MGRKVHPPPTRDSASEESLISPTQRKGEREGEREAWREREVIQRKMGVGGEKNEPRV